MTLWVVCKIQLGGGGRPMALQQEQLLAFEICAKRGRYARVSLFFILSNKSSSIPAYLLAIFENKALAQVPLAQPEGWG